MQGYYRKGQMRPVLTGRAARRAETRHQARAFAREHNMRVITHVHRAIAAASLDGHLTASAYLATLGVDSRFSSAFGKAVRKAYLENHGVEPDRSGLSIVNGRMRRTYRYSNELDLIAGALAYARTADLVLAMPGHPVALHLAGV